MEENKPFQFKPWMLVTLAVAVLLLVSNFDPVGDTLEKALGQGADKFIINLIAVGAVVYALFTIR